MIIVKASKNKFINSFLNLSKSENARNAFETQFFDMPLNLPATLIAFLSVS